MNFKRERVLDGWVRVSRFAIKLDVWVRVSLELNGVNQKQYDFFRDTSSSILARRSSRHPSPAFFLHTTEWLTIEQDFHIHTIIIHHTSSEGTYVRHRKKSAGTTRFFCSRAGNENDLSHELQWPRRLNFKNNHDFVASCQPSNAHKFSTTTTKNRWRRQLVRKTKKRPKAFPSSFDISISTTEITQ